MNLPQLVFSSYPGQIFWLFVSFGIMYFISAKYLIPGFEKSISSRFLLFVNLEEELAQISSKCNLEAAIYEDKLRIMASELKLLAEDSNLQHKILIAEYMKTLEISKRNIDSQLTSVFLEKKQLTLEMLKPVAHQALSELVRFLTGNKNLSNHLPTLERFWKF